AVRETHEGVIGSYVHSNHKVAVLVALLCETDFVARNEKFQELARNIAMHIAAMDPLVVSPNDVSDDVIEEEKTLALKQLAQQDKPEDIKAKIVEGKLKKFREEQALLSQPYVKDSSKTVEDLLKESIAELGENITVKEFSRLTV
ncbi:MAG: elongation factor Ts, partial [Acidobacteriota bacterium]